MRGVFTCAPEILFIVPNLKPRLAMLCTLSPFETYELSQEEGLVICAEMTKGEEESFL